MHHRVVLYDLAGYGESQELLLEQDESTLDTSVKTQADLLAELLSHLQLDGKGSNATSDVIAHDNRRSDCNSHSPASFMGATSAACFCLTQTQFCLGAMASTSSCVQSPKRSANYRPPSTRPWFERSSGVGASIQRTWTRVGRISWPGRGYQMAATKQGSSTAS